MLTAKMDFHARQVALSEVGTQGMATLSGAHALVVGLGALGSAAAELLLRSGVGHLTLQDFDIVQQRNLGSQSLYGEGDLGKLKVAAAQAHLTQITETCRISTVATPFSGTESLSAFSIIIDGTDSLQTRMVLNDAAKQAGTPLVIATVADTHGMVFTVADGACWQCLTLGKKASDGCDSGVLTAAARLIASYQVVAALKALLQKPEPQLLVVDAWKNTLRAIVVQRHPRCAACRGTYSFLNQPFEVSVCSANNRLQMRPSRPHHINLEVYREGLLEQYENAVRVQLADGSVLIHRHGLLEFDDVSEDTARAFAATTLGVNEFPR